jgi:hypothetical protein
MECQLDNSVRGVCIKDQNQFYTMEQEWNCLVQKSDQNSVFMCHEWFEAVWQWRKMDCDLRLLCVYKNDILIGICPLICRQMRFYTHTIRIFGFLSIPDTQLCDIITTPDHHVEVAKAIAKILYEMRYDWDRLDLQKLPAASRSLKLLPDAMARYGIRVVTNSCGSNLTIPLEGEWDPFYARRTRRLKKGNNHLANRLHRKYKSVELRWIHGDINTNELDVDIHSIIQISSRSWKKETGLSLENSGPNNFIYAITHHAQRQGWLSIWILLLNGIPAAMEYQLIYKGNVHALRADYDDFFSEISPGGYLNWKMLEKLFDGKFRRYLMGPGNNPYKLRWVEDFDPLYGIIGYGGSLRGRLLSFIEQKVRPLIKQLTKKSIEKKQ